MRTKQFALALILWVALANPAYAAPKAYLMAAIGDSITAATFANHSASGDTMELAPLLGPGSRIPFLGKWENKETYSWASGQEIQSHWALLQRWAGEAPVTVINVATPGNMAEHVAGQAENVATFVSQTSSTLSYVTLMIGANDVCARDSGEPTSDEILAKHLGRAFAVLAQIKQAEPIRILVSGIPKIPDLGRPEILDMRTVSGMRCELVRDRMEKACNLITEWTTPAEYQDRVNLVESKNKVIARAAAEARHLHPNLDIVYTNRFYETPIQPQWLARDCFHPNALGQQELSKRLWEEQPWFK